MKMDFTQILYHLSHFMVLWEVGNFNPRATTTLIIGIDFIFPIN